MVKTEREMKWKESNGRKSWMDGWILRNQTTLSRSFSLSLFLSLSLSLLRKKMFFSFFVGFFFFNFIF